MTRISTNLLIAAALFLAGTLATVSAGGQALAANDCLNRRAAQEATVSGQILQLQQIYAQNGLRPQDVVDRKICRRDGELFYVLSVYLDDRADTVWINARTGVS